jgi:hypothetical protein
VPRIPRGQQGDYVYRIINRGNRRATVFYKSQDYEAFLSLLSEAKTRHCALPAVIFTPWESLLPYPVRRQRSKASRKSSTVKSCPKFGRHYAQRDEKEIFLALAQR